MKIVRLIALALVALGVALLGQGQQSVLADGEYGTLYIDVDNTDGASTVTTFGGVATVDVCRDTDDLGGPLEIGDTFSIDIIVDDATNTISGAQWTLDYEGDTPGPAVLKVSGFNWSSWKFGSSGIGIDDPLPDTDGTFATAWAGNPVTGDGVLQRITMEAIANGQSDLTLANAQVSGEVEAPHAPPEIVVVDSGNVRVVVGGTCPLTPGPTPAPTVSPTPTPSPPATPTPTPPGGPTRISQWGPGWHNATWTGTSTPEEAFACAAGNYAAVYRLAVGGWERHFPDRPGLSNITDLGQYDAFLILITGDVTCEMPVADPAATERTLDWGVGWQNEGWTGPDGTMPQDAFACADGSYAAAYRYGSAGWERYFPDRAEISNMRALNKYDAFLILVTAPVSCIMPIAP